MTKSKDYSWIWEWLFILGMILLSTFILSSCREARELKKDNKAFSRVLSDDSLSLRMDKALNKIYPCVNTVTQTKYLPGKTVTKNIPYLDTNALKKSRDSAFKVYAEKFKSDNDQCAVDVTNAYNTGFDQGVYEASKNVPPSTHTTNTVIQTERDDIELDRMTAERDVLSGMYAQSEKQAESSAKLAKNRLLWLIGICVAIGLLIIGWIWAKFRK